MLTHKSTQDSLTLTDRRAFLQLSLAEHYSQRSEMSERMVWQGEDIAEAE